MKVGPLHHASVGGACMRVGVGLEKEGHEERERESQVGGLHVNPRGLGAGGGRGSQIPGAILPSYFPPALGRCFLPQSLCGCLGIAAPSSRSCFHSQEHPPLTPTPYSPEWLGGSFPGA